MNQARNPDFTTESGRQVEELDALGWYHSMELPDGTTIKGFQTIEQLRWRLAQFPISQNLSGKRVLDVGAWDGWFSFEMERRGAQVVAVDTKTSSRFLQARSMLSSSVEYIEADICHLTPKQIGYFDIVLCLGVLYHVKHPLLALERICELSTDLACIESFVIDNGDDTNAIPVMEFYEGTELRGQFDNWVGPNLACLLAFSRTAGFARVKRGIVAQNRAHVTCHRTWSDCELSGAPPTIVNVENSVTRESHFSSSRDEYLSIWFKTDRRDLRSEDVFPQVGRYGSRAAVLHSTGGDGWHLDCKLPPGLASGRHEVRLRIGQSTWSNARTIYVDTPEEPDIRIEAIACTEELKIVSVVDGKTWQLDAVETRWISLWARGLPSTSRAEDVHLQISGTVVIAAFVSTPDEQGHTQINVQIPQSIPAGPATITLAFAAHTASYDFRIIK